VTTPSSGELNEELQFLRESLQQIKGVLPERLDVDPEGVEQGLGKLVLTIVELVRQLLERQAVRRMDGGTLSEDEVERMGLALMRLDQKMNELAEHFGVTREELNINLGPLGNLL
jgi:hypothetical protein